MLAAMDGEAAERDWLGVQCAVSPKQVCSPAAKRSGARVYPYAAAQRSDREALRRDEGL